MNPEENLEDQIFKNKISQFTQGMVAGLGQESGKYKERVSNFSNLYDKTKRGSDQSNKNIHSTQYNETQ